jgi:putative ABC transport system permease protein
MRGIARKALSDLRSHPLQTALLFLVIAASAATLSLGLHVQASASEPYERLRAESKGADAWILSSSPAADWEGLASLPYVESVVGPYPISTLNYGLRNGDKKQQVEIIGMPAQLPEFDHPVVTDGRWLNPGANDEVVVDKGAARLLNFRIGQKVDLLTANGPRPLTIVGFAVPTGRAPAPINDPAYVFVLPQTLQSIEPGAVFGTSFDYGLRAGIKVRDAAAFDRLFGDLQNLGFTAFSLRTASNVRDNIRESNQFDVIFLNVFSIFALIASGLVLANSVGGQVLSQVRDIGIMKAIGFTPRQVALTLLLQNLGLGLAAAAVGIAASLLIVPFFLDRSAEILGVTAGAAFKPDVIVITLALILAIVGLFTLIPAWRAGRLGAVEALAAGTESRRLRPSRMAALAARLGLPRVAVVGLKDLSRRPMRTAMTVFAIVLAVVTATFSLGIESTFKATMSDPTVIGGPPFDITADRDVEPEADARRILDSLPEIESYVAKVETSGQVQPVPGQFKSGRRIDIAGYEGDLQEPRWGLRKGRMPARPGEAAVSVKLAEDAGYQVGQTLTVRLGFPPNSPGAIEASFTIVGEYADIEGAVLTVTRDSLPPGLEVTDYLIKARPGADTKALSEALIEASAGNFDPEILSNTVADIRNQWRPVLLGLNGVLLGIAGLNLLASLLLTIRERRRDFAVLKTIGFTPGQVAGSVFAGSAFLAAIAVAVGLPLGLVATRMMFDVLSTSAGIGGGVGKMPGVLWLAPLVPGALAVAALGTMIPARRAAAVHVAEALRYE